jgi:hypothetical protein
MNTFKVFMFIIIIISVPCSDDNKFHSVTGGIISRLILLFGLPISICIYQRPLENGHYKHGLAKINIVDFKMFEQGRLLGNRFYHFLTVAGR